MDPRLYHRPRIEWWQLRRRWQRWRDDLQHHSAPIRRTHWQSVVLAWMWGSLAIAPFVAIAGHLIIKRMTVETLEARFHRVGGGRWVDAGGRDLDDPAQPAVDLANEPTTWTTGVTITLERQRSGWPTVSGETATLTAALRPLSEHDPSTGNWPAPNPVRARDSVLERNRIDSAQFTGEPSIVIAGFLINAMVAWPIAFAVCWVGALLGRSMQLFLWRRRARIETGRAQDGLCPGCGHIVNRSGFSARCPECGYFLHQR